MIKVGITGGIGSGKSIVSNIFKILNIPVFDADFEAKKIMTESVVVKQQLIATFGNAVFLNKELNRQYLSTIVFSDAHLLEKLNAIVHPAIIDAGNEWANQQISPYVIKEAALLFEAGSASDLDYVIGVYAPKIIRLQRVMQRDKVDKQAVLNRMSKQIDEEIKMKLCDFIITNDDEQMVIPQVLKLHEKFLAMSNM